MNSKAQSAIDYLTTYSWAIIVVAIIMAILYFYLTAPAQIVSNSCNFVNGANCNEAIVTTNSMTHSTAAAFFLTNAQSYPIANPKLYVQVNQINSSIYSCSPNYVLSGGSILCTVTIPTNTALGDLVFGNVYLSATACGLSATYYPSTHNCTNGINQTYSGRFQYHTQPSISISSTLLLSVANSTQTANNNPDRLVATVKLMGYPLKGATVNFSVNSISYTLTTNLTTTNTVGSAVSYIYGNSVGIVAVNAYYAGLSNSVTINFIAPVTLKFSPNFLYCALSGNVLLVDNVPYTCTQLQSTKFSYTKGTTHSYSFVTPITITAKTRESFKSIILNGIPYSSTSGNIVVTKNTTAAFNYNAQYYVTENVLPSSHGLATPGSGWYNASSQITLTETPNSPYTFNTWTCTGTGCYSGSASNKLITLSNVINETANFH